MPTIAGLATQTLTLPAGQVLTIDALDSSAVGTITRLQDSVGGEPFAPVAIAGVDFTLGPYGTTRRYVIAMSVGSVTYSMAVNEPTNSALRGQFTMNGTTPVTVANANFAAGDIVCFTLRTVAGTVGAYPSIKTVTPGTGFTVAGTAADTSVYDYAITKAQS